METLLFSTAQAFRQWLGAREGDEGAWLVFGKKGGPKTLSAKEALEEALCFGWIDGQMKSVDEGTYVKYFSPRRAGSVWSEKNRGIAQALQQQGRMTDAGRAAIEDAKRRGTWQGAQRMRPTEEDALALERALAGHEPACENYKRMTPSVRRAYAGAYRDVQSQQARERRLASLIERLDLGLNPMESMAKAKEKRKERGEDA